MAGNHKTTALETARRSYVQAYVKAHPKLTRNAAVSRANKLFAGPAGRATLPKAVKGQHTRQYAPPKYPRLYKAARAQGLSPDRARRAANSLFKLNHAYYDKRDHPPKETRMHYAESHFEEREGGTKELVFGDLLPFEEEVEFAEIQDEHFSEFYDWWDEYFGADTWDDRHDIYAEG